MRPYRTGRVTLCERWWTPLQPLQPGWVCARENGRPRRFVNVACGTWVHAFILDTVGPNEVGAVVSGTRLVAVANEMPARRCEWCTSISSRTRSFLLRCVRIPTDHAGMIQSDGCSATPARPPL